jgi:hypothetical protein
MYRSIIFFQFFHMAVKIDIVPWNLLHEICRMQLSEFVYNMRWGCFGGEDVHSGLLGCDCVECIPGGLKMETVWSSETLVPVYKFTRSRNQRRPRWALFAIFWGHTSVEKHIASCKVAFCEVLGPLIYDWETQRAFSNNLSTAVMP